MPGFRSSEAARSRPPGRTMNKKRSTVSFDIAVDEDGPQNGNTAHDSIDLTPSHQIPDQLGSAAPESKSSEASTQAREPQSPQHSALPLESQPSQPSILAPETGSSTFPPSSTDTLSQPQHHVPRIENQQDHASQKWEANEWDPDVFDGDDVDMSLAIMTKLAHRLSILKDFLELYRRFNVHLGGEQKTLHHPTTPLVLHLSLTPSNNHQMSSPGPVTKAYSTLSSRPYVISNHTLRTCASSATGSSAATWLPAPWNS